MEAAEIARFADCGGLPQLTVRAGVSGLRSVVEGRLNAFNARGFDAIAQQFDHDIQSASTPASYTAWRRCART